MEEPSLVNRIDGIPAAPLWILGSKPVRTLSSQACSRMAKTSFGIPDLVIIVVLSLDTGPGRGNEKKAPEGTVSYPEAAVRPSPEIVELTLVRVL